jgi:hypothetical protein
VRRGGDCPSPGRCRVRRLLLFEQGLRRRLPARSRDARARVWRHRSVGCQGHAPVAAVLAPVMNKKKSHSTLSAHPKASPPPPYLISPAKRRFLRVPKWGPWVPIMDPTCRAAPSRDSWRRRSCPRCGSTSRAWQRADEAFCAPKGFGTLAPWPFSLQNGTSEGAEGGAMGADHRPQQPAAVTSARGLGGEGRAPVVAVLSRPTKKAS